MASFVLWCAWLYLFALKNEAEILGTFIRITYIVNYFIIDFCYIRQKESNLLVKLL